MRRFLKVHAETILILAVVLPAFTYVMCVVGPEQDRVAQVASK